MEACRNAIVLPYSMSSFAVPFARRGLTLLEMLIQVLRSAESQLLLIPLKSALRSAQSCYRWSELFH